MSPARPAPRPSAAEPPSRPGAGPSVGEGWALAPVALRVVVVLTLLEALALAVVSLWGFTRIGDGGSGSVGVFLVVFALGVAVLLAVSCRALLRGRRIGRAPVATWQLLQVATSAAVLQAGVPAAWVTLSVALVVFFLLMTRPVVERTTGR